MSHQGLKDRAPKSRTVLENRGLSLKFEDSWHLCVSGIFVDSIMLDFPPVDLSLFPLSFRVLVLAEDSVHPVGLAYVLV